MPVFRSSKTTGGARHGSKFYRYGSNKPLPRSERKIKEMIEKLERECQDAKGIERSRLEYTINQLRARLRGLRYRKAKQGKK